MAGVRFWPLAACRERQFWVDSGRWEVGVADDPGRILVG